MSTQYVSSHTRDGVSAAFEMANVCAKIRDALSIRISRQHLWDCDDAITRERQRFRDLRAVVGPLASVHLPLGQHNEFRQTCDYFDLGLHYWLSAVESTRQVLRIAENLESKLGPDPNAEPENDQYLDLVGLDEKNFSATVAQARNIADICRCLAEKAQQGFEPTVPRFDEETGELMFGGETVRKLARRAKNAWPVLKAFQAQCWPALLPDPLIKSGYEDAERIHRTCKILNRGQRRIRFQAAGDGKCYSWKVTEK